MDDEKIPSVDGYHCKCGRWYDFTPYDQQHKGNSTLHIKCACGVVNRIIKGLPQPTAQVPRKV